MNKCNNDANLMRIKVVVKFKGYSFLREGIIKGEWAMVNGEFYNGG
jgi:hypothetical protein